MTPGIKEYFYPRMDDNTMDYTDAYGIGSAERFGICISAVWR